MTTPDNQAWWYVEINLKPKFVPNAGDVQLKFVNRPMLQGTLGAFHPLLKSISGLGNNMGDYLPEGVKGQIVLENSPHTFGYERRFSDTLERYSLIGQPVKVYAAETTIDDLDPTSDFALVWQGICTGHQTSFQGGQSSISLDISSEIIPRRTVTKVIDLTQFPDAPSGALGNHLPVVFGTDVQVKPIRVNADGSATPQWAYATTFANEFVVGGVQTYYVKSKEGDYIDFVNPASTTTALFSRTAAGDNAGAVINGVRELVEVLSGGTSGIVTQVIFQTYHDNTNTQDGTLIVTLYESSPLPSGSYGTGEPYEEVGRCEISFSGYTTAGVNSMHGSFEQPVVLRDSKTYLIGVHRNTETTANNDVHLNSPTATTGTTQYKKRLYDTTATQGQRAWKSFSIGNNMKWELFGVRFDDDVNPSASEINQEGLGHALLTASQRTAGSGQTNPDISRLDLILEIDGLEDDGSGTITATPNTTIESTLYAISLLDRVWSGSSWGAGVFNFTESSTIGIRQVATDLYNRFLEGRTDGQVLLPDLLQEICRNTGCRIYQFLHATDPMAVWGFGQMKATSAVIDDEDAEVISIQQLGTESIVNRAQMFYNRGLTQADFNRGTAEGQFKDFRGALDWYNGLDSLTTELTSHSESIYGKRFLRDQAFNWLSQEASAESVAHYLLATFGLPHNFVKIDIPFFKYSALDMMDVIEITHPDLPAFLGTTSDANLPTYGTTEVDINSGQYWKRAKRYRALIEGKEIQFNIDEFPKMRLTCRILQNYPKEPT